MADRIVLVTGTTGQQGGAVAAALMRGGFKVRALVRDPKKPAAEALARAGAELAVGDLGDAAAQIGFARVIIRSREDQRAGAGLGQRSGAGNL